MLIRRLTRTLNARYVLHDMEFGIDPKFDTREQGLLRDSFRCMITGKVNHKQWKKGGPDWTTTNCAHIFSKSTTVGLDENEEEKVEYASFFHVLFMLMCSQAHHAPSAWHLLDRFGYQNIIQDLAGKNIHSLTNVLTLDHTIHTAFGNLKVWLKGDKVCPIFNFPQSAVIMFPCSLRAVASLIAMKS